MHAIVTEQERDRKSIAPATVGIYLNKADGDKRIANTATEVYELHVQAQKQAQLRANHDNHDSELAKRKAGVLSSGFRHSLLRVVQGIARRRSVTSYREPALSF